MVLIRQVQVTDAVALSALLSKLNAETPFMAMGEQNSAAELSEHLELFIDSATQVLFVIEDGAKLIGFAIGITGYISGDSNTAALVIGIVQANIGMGFGGQLLAHIEAWAQGAQLQRLELTVMINNENAIVFYEKAGFKQQTVKPREMIPDLTENELYMLKVVNFK